MKLKVLVKKAILKKFSKSLVGAIEAEQQGTDPSYCCHSLTCWSFKASSLITEQELWKE